MKRLLLTTALLAGCSKTASIDPFDPLEEAIVPTWIQNEIAGQENACDSLDTIPAQARVATGFFAGNFEWDGNDDLVGNEFWLLFPDAELAATGFVACTVVWDVVGTRVDAAGAADYSLEISGSVDTNQTDCVEDAVGTPVYVGDENFSVVYDVVEQSNGSANVFFQSGTLLGRGEANNRGLTWVSERDCKIF